MVPFYPRSCCPHVQVDRDHLYPMRQGYHLDSHPPYETLHTRSAATARRRNLCYLLSKLVSTDPYLIIQVDKLKRSNIPYYLQLSCLHCISMTELNILIPTQGICLEGSTILVHFDLLVKFMAESERKVSIISRPTDRGSIRTNAHSVSWSNPAPTDKIKFR